MCICFNDALRQWASPEAVEAREALLQTWGAALRDAAGTLPADPGQVSVPADSQAAAPAVADAGHRPSAVASPPAVEAQA